MKPIILAHDHIAIVDDCDFEFANQWRWSFDEASNSARRSCGNGKFVRLHRAIAERMGLSADKCVVCKDGSPLNCTRDNLQESHKDKTRRTKPTIETVLPDGCRLIPLSRGKQAVVSPEDYEYLTQWSWHLCVHGYAARRPETGMVYMHRAVMERVAPDLYGLEVDHIDLDKLNNRRSNLRVATRAQNARNRGLLPNNTSGYMGVSWDRTRSKWLACIEVDATRHSIGRFDTAVEAAKAYNAAAKAHFGEFARVNPV